MTSFWCRLTIRARLTVVLLSLLHLYGAAPVCGAAPAIRAASPSRAVTMTELTAEYQAQPLAIAVAQPHLGWLLQSSQRGQRQTAYQILVASQASLLVAQQADLWDSGKVPSGQSFNVLYQGRALRSEQRCYWKVRVWDKNGTPSAWSATNFWQVGLRQPGDWSAQWITPDTPVDNSWQQYDLDVDLRIIRKQVGVVFRAQDSQNLYMWQFSVAGGRPRLRRHLCLGGNWQVHEVDLPAPTFAPIAQEGGQFSTGWHHLKIEVREGGVRSLLDEKLVDAVEWNLFSQVLPGGTVGFRTGETDEAGAFKHLRVQSAAPETEGRSPGTAGKSLLTDDFTGENHFSDGRIDAANQQLLLAQYQLALSQNGTDATWRSPLFRKEFVSIKPVKRATAHVFGLGWYELYLNGVKADDRVLAPANTPYQRRKLYDTYDLTPLLKKGGNALGLWLGDGYRKSNYSRWGWSWDGLPGVLLQLDIVYADGSTARIVTDDSWRCKPSPITFNHIYDGETYDARLEQANWNKFGLFVDTPNAAQQLWQPVRATGVDYAALAPSTAPPIKVVQMIRPVGMFHPAPDRFVFDMGQNFAGWVRLRVHGPAGTSVVLRHSEEINPQTKRLEAWTNRNAKATDTYILKGVGRESHEPRFTYHGFRYVEVQGYPGTPTLDDVQGCVVHTAAPEVGHFHSSDPLLNQIQSNIQWGMSSNRMSIPTDCPQRDERTPCQMDSAAYEEAAMYNYDLHTYYLKWLDDIRGDTGQPDWGGDQVTLCWRLYQFYGDKDILAQSYNDLKHYLESHRRQVEDASDPNYLFKSGFGDWCAPNPDGEHNFSSVRETNTALYYHQLLTFAAIAQLLGRAADAAQYTALAGTVKDVFNREFWQAGTGQYSDGRQTTALLPLAFNLVPDAQKPRLTQNLLHNIQVDKNGHLDTGIYGTRYFMDVLSDLGDIDTAYTSLHQPTYPGFGYQIAQGATTLWEQWHFKGGMQSHNHAMFSGIGASFYSRLGGISPKAPGYSAIMINPQLPHGLTFVETSFKTLLGTVQSNWRIENPPGTTKPRFHLQVTVPPTAIAEVHLPTQDAAAITESGAPLARHKEVRLVGVQHNRIVLAIGSGTYDFMVAAGAWQY
ncbi:MAG: family 78 glycoside hydrolase catalytic domain [Abitibacteriaceae bacterium]|nr:family 78 glycoside hydrolase catalytic domain [Abditibacteriaceae bacterium]